MTTRELIERFEDGSLPGHEFGHRQHVQAAWGFLERFPLGEALDRFSEALRRFALRNGSPQRFHVTITTAYLLLIAERRARHPEDGWDAFAVRNPDLLTWAPSVLDQYYEPETLRSDVARCTFVMPDRLQPAAAPRCRSSSSEASPA